ncbi:MAG: type II toxin-antitoxin system HicB family antitoxin [Acidobacteriaceae bacterium]|nr:type II toxin-antitoxin system HicB family antitoxin [Acidobacteriaceae bacterium]
MERQRLTAIIERENEGFVALCPELDIASQGRSIEEARTNLVEALSLFFETASPSEVTRRFHSEVFVTQVEVTWRPRDNEGMVDWLLACPQKDFFQTITPES